MSEATGKTQFSFDCEVLKVFEEEGSRIAWVVAPAFFFKVVADQSVRFGDLVRVAGSMDAKIVCQLSEVKLPANDEQVHREPADSNSPSGLVADSSCCWDA